MYFLSKLYFSSNLFNSVIKYCGKNNRKNQKSDASASFLAGGEKCVSVS